MSDEFAGNCEACGEYKLDLSPTIRIKDVPYPVPEAVCRDCRCNEGTQEDEVNMDDPDEIPEEDEDSLEPDDFVDEVCDDCENIIKYCICPHDDDEEQDS